MSAGTFTGASLRSRDLVVGQMIKLHLWPAFLLEVRRAPQFTGTSSAFVRRPKLLPLYISCCKRIIKLDPGICLFPNRSSVTTAAHTTLPGQRDATKFYLTTAFLGDAHSRAHTTDPRAHT